MAIKLLRVKIPCTSIFLTVFCSTLLLSGCGSQAQRPKPVFQLPEYEQVSGVNMQEKPKSDWWQDYGSAELTRLFEQLRFNNLDLATAKVRIEQARALLDQQRAENWPTLETQLSSSNSRDLDTHENQNSSGLNFSAGYEVDLWGRRSAAELGAKLSVIAQQQEYQSLLLQLQATLAQSYFELLALRERQAIAGQNLQASQNLLDLIQLRFEAGSASGIELNQQRNTWLSTRAQLFDLERARVSSERALAVLLGRELSTPALQGTLSDMVLPAVSLVQPAALLEYRPDIQLAHTQWRLSETTLYQEEKKRWPQLRLSAGLGLADVFDGGESWLASVAGSLAAPLFDAGLIRNQILTAESGLTISEHNYRQTVLIAMQDVLETLSELSYQQRLLTVRQEELVSNQKLYDLAKLRYDSGDTDFINLLTAQRSKFSASDNLIQAKKNQLLATVNVFRAMGITPEIIN